MTLTVDGKKGSLAVECFTDEAGYPEIIISGQSQLVVVIPDETSATNQEIAVSVPSRVRITLGNNNGQVLWENETPCALPAVQPPKLGV